LLNFIKVIQQAERLRGGSPAGDTELNEGWAQDEGGLLIKDSKVWISGYKPLQDEILLRNHDDLTVGHAAAKRTAQVLRMKYYWPKRWETVQEYIRTCLSCQRGKSLRHQPYGRLMPLQAPSRAWRHWSMDFVTDLPPSSAPDGKACDAICVVVDRLTKYIFYFPISITVTQKGLQIYCGISC